MVYRALLPLMRTPLLPVVDWTDAPADLNGLVRFGERRNLVSARVSSHFKRSLPYRCCHLFWLYSSGPFCNVILRQKKYCTFRYFLYLAHNFRIRLKVTNDVAWPFIALTQRKVSFSFVMTVRPSACTSAAPTRRIWVKFGVGDVTNSNFRFVWPCIINVGEERTNGWHK